MEICLTDPSYADRLAAFLRSLGQTATVSAPAWVDVRLASGPDALVELEIYLRVWSVLYPEAGVQVRNGEEGEDGPLAAA
jgi:hypothetical protein